MYKIGLSSSAFALNEENFCAIQKSGLEAIEVSERYDRCKLLNFGELAALSAKYGVKLWSLHLPFFPFKFIDISSPNKEIRDNTITLYTELIEKASDVGIDKFVIHPSGEPIADEDREEYIKYSMQSLDTIAEIAHRNGARIAVEDLPRTCLGNTADELLRLLSVNDKLRVCFDINHLLKDTPFDLIDKLGDKIITLHVSDYDRIDERHWLPGEGVNDWSGIYEALRGAGYDGVWMYEVGFRSNTIERSRPLTFSDFYENAQAIFEGRTPKRIY